MPRRSKKWIAEILTPSSPYVEPTTDVHASSQSSIRNDNIHDIALDRKITIATEGFTTRKFCELVLKDRSKIITTKLHAMNPCSTCNENVSRACFEETAAYIGRGGFTGILGNQSPKIQHVKVPLNKVVCLFYE